MIKGFSTPEGTARFASRFPGHQKNGFFRETPQRTLSAIGIGTYLGAMDEAADRGYEASVEAAIDGGVNVIDTSLNYRNQRSEKNIGAALARMNAAGKLQRDEILVCTKAGYLVPNAIPSVPLKSGELVANAHSMAPAFLEDQLERSRQNLGLETIDVFYLHNPETQFKHFSEDEFYQRVYAAFYQMEKFCGQGKIAYYGIATWDGLRKDRQLSLEHFTQVALEVGGPLHHFRFAQMPLNLGMTEAFSLPTQSLSSVPTNALHCAGRMGLTAIGSASIMESRLASGLPDHVREKLGMQTDAQRALQFSRSTPGMVVSLAGMSNPAHVAENLAVAGVPSTEPEKYFKLFVQ